jgi:hypothetical protein
VKTLDLDTGLITPKKDKINIIKEIPNSNNFFLVGANKRN